MTKEELKKKFEVAVVEWENEATPLFKGEHDYNLAQFFYFAGCVDGGEAVAKIHEDIYHPAGANK